MSDLDKISAETVKKISSKIVRKGCILYRDSVRNALASSGIQGIHNKGSRYVQGSKRPYSDTLYDSVRCDGPYTDGLGAIGKVRISSKRNDSTSGAYRLPMLNGGTRKRYNVRMRKKDRQVPSGALYRGQIKAYNFLKKGESAGDAKFNDIANGILSEEMAKSEFLEEVAKTISGNK